MEGRKEALEYLRGLPSIDLSGEKIIKGLILPEIEEANRVDLSDAEGERLTVRAKFVNYLDLSGGVFGKVILKGVFNVVDVSGAMIRTLDVTQAEVWNLDDSEAEIGHLPRKE